MMAGGTLPFQRMLRVALVFSTPAFVVLAALAGLGAVTAQLATLTAGAIFIGLMIVSWLQHRDVARIVAHLYQLSPGDPGDSDLDDSDRVRWVPQSPLREALDGAVHRLHREWHAAHSDQGRQLAVARRIVDALDDAVLILDGQRQVTHANGAALSLFGPRVVGRDLSESMRHPTVLSAVDRAARGLGPGVVELSQPVPIPRVFEVRVKAFGGAANGDNPAVEADEDLAAAPGAPAADAASPPNQDGHAGLRPPTADGDGDDVSPHSTPLRQGTAAELDDDLARLDGDPWPFASQVTVLLALHDITAVKRSEQMRADFVANASHELRTPLSTLIGFIDTLRGPARDDPKAQHRFLAIMDDQAHRMSRLVDDLLSLSRIELDEHTPPRGEVELPTVLAAVLTSLDLRAREREMTVAVDMEPNLPRVVGDEDQINQVVQNLIDNAIKYGRAGTVISVSVARGPLDESNPAPAVVVTVSDTGDGIAREHLPRLTERFYRVDPARSRAVGGTGLGLAIVKHILSRHRGRLTIESERGQGSTFTIALPATVAKGRDDGVTHPSRPAFGSAGGGGRPAQSAPGVPGAPTAAAGPPPHSVGALPDAEKPL